METSYRWVVAPTYKAIRKEDIMIQTPFYRIFENKKHKHK